MSSFLEFSRLVRHIARRDNSDRIDSIAWVDVNATTSSISVIEGSVGTGRSIERERGVDRLDYTPRRRLQPGRDRSSCEGTFARSCARSINYRGMAMAPSINSFLPTTKNSVSNPRMCSERRSRTCSTQTEKIELPWNKFNGGG